MSADRIPCPNCGALILEVTAQYNGGLCAPCKRNCDAALNQRCREDARRNALPPPIHYSFFTRKQFVEGLSRACLPHRMDPAKVCGEFLGFCDPILQKSSGAFLVALFFHRQLLFRNLTRIPRPYREWMAVYQAWGMISSNGFESYVGNSIPKFDAEVDRGLVLLGFEKVGGVVSDARSVFRKSKGEIPEKAEDELWRKFYDSMPDFETDILGPQLIAQLAIEEKESVAGGT